jgi:hypothetical protein
MSPKLTENCIQGVRKQFATRKIKYTMTNIINSIPTHIETTKCIYISILYIFVVDGKEKILR